MTTREIAEAVGKDPATVSRWIVKASCKMQSISCKMQEALKTKMPANYVEAETLAIIDHGMGKNAAGIFRANIQNKLPQKKGTEDRLDRLEIMVEKLLMLQIQQTMQPKQIDFIQDYYTIKGYASKKGIQITYSEAVNFGRIAAKISKQNNLEIRKADDERFGQVGSYHISVLDEVFSL